MLRDINNQIVAKLFPFTAFTETSYLGAVEFISKYIKHTPFYCLEDTYNWQGICISRQNMCYWSLKVHERLKPLEKLLPWIIEITPYKIRGEWI